MNLGVNGANCDVYILSAAMLKQQNHFLFLFPRLLFFSFRGLGCVLCCVGSFWIKSPSFSRCLKCVSASPPIRISILASFESFPSVIHLHTSNYGYIKLLSYGSLSPHVRTIFVGEQCHTHIHTHSFRTHYHSSQQRTRSLHENLPQSSLREVVCSLRTPLVCPPKRVRHAYYPPASLNLPPSFGQHRSFTSDLYFSPCWINHG